MDIAALYSIYRQHPSIQTDTRKLQKGDIFFALKGPSFNGNEFAMQALNAGAAYAVIDEEIGSNDERLIKTEDALTTLQQLAKHHREQFTTLADGISVPFIAVTGSNGKTTTKELVHAVLSSHYITYTTQGNLNNHIGIPLTILQVKKDAQLVVIEMGANHQKEIEGYCSYTQPTHGLITNCGKAHLQGFGGIEGVRKGKGELFDYLRNCKGVVFAFNDYEYLHEMVKGINEIYWYGTAHGSITGHAIANETFLNVSITKGVTFSLLQTRLVGDYNLPNILCAVAIGKYFKVPDDKIKMAIENYIPSNSRSQLMEKGSNKIILDAYNANPTSMKAAIVNFAKNNTPEKVLMLGGMMELGDDSIREHENIVELINEYKWKAVVLVGGDFKNTQHPFHYFNTSTEAKAWLHQQQFKNAYFLVKGSRSMQMEKVLED